MRVGTSGWVYPSWRGDFYPAGLRQRDELAHLAGRLTSAELNGSFYSLQRAASYRSWRDQTPEDFVFSVKGGRFITHMLRLVGVETALANFFASGLLALGPKLGPVLWQLPERLTFEAGVLDAFLAALPKSTAEAAELARRHDADKVRDPLTRAEADVRLLHALEFRSPTFQTPEAYAILREHGVASVVADAATSWPQVEEDTADLRYVRLHGHFELYASGYSSASLDRWAGRCRTWAAAGQDVYVYFNNDARGRAPHDAESLLARLA